MRNLVVILICWNISTCAMQNTQLVSSEMCERAQQGLGSLMVGLNQGTTIRIDGCSVNGRALALGVVAFLANVQENRLGPYDKERVISEIIVKNDDKQIIYILCKPQSVYARIFYPTLYIGIGAAGASAVWYAWNHLR